MKSLKKLTERDVDDLIRSLEKQNNPESIHALCFMKQVTQWKKKVPEVDCSVYSPNGDFTDNTFILTFIIDGGVFCTYYSASEAGCIRLRDALLETNLISDDSYCVLTSIADRVNKIVGLEWRTRLAGPYQHTQNCHDYFLSELDAVALNVPCPEDAYIRYLTEDDAELVNSRWPHRNSRSLKLIKGIINSSVGIGLCSKENDKLLSWALKWYYGGIGVVHTEDHARRKGYARAVSAALIKEMLNEKWPIHLVIIDGNPQSIPMYIKMGFKPISKCHWYYFNVFDKIEKSF